MYRQLSPIPEKAESPSLSDLTQQNIFRLYVLSDQPATSAFHLFPDISKKAQDLQNLTLHAHLQDNAYITGRLVCGKHYNQVIEHTIAGCLEQPAEPHRTIRQRLLENREFLERLQ